MLYKLNMVSYWYRKLIIIETWSKIVFMMSKSTTLYLTVQADCGFRTIWMLV